MKHPIQRITIDKHGKPRFVENPIVRYILDNGGIGLNNIARQGFDPEDRQQFAQLIGYSLGGYSELSYVTDEALNAAEATFEKGETAEHAMIRTLEQKLKILRTGLRGPVAELYGIHPDDLGRE